ncbi:MAG TPA: type VI secretion system baseplate subunit TssG [Xanthomonadales bacterium]|nr:type VI secretion system baseplate subunit TssG [Xanthomonadales bacterium]
MAGENGYTTEALALLQSMQDAPYRYGFFSAVRRINCAFPDQSRTGLAFRPEDDPIRFGQPPYMSFAPSTLNAVDFEGPDGKPRISQLFIGLFGPNGPLPLHLTEHARHRQRHARDSANVGFADAFHHRIVSLFYRAWAQGKPTVQADRQDQDRFAFYISALAGYGMETAEDADSMPRSAKLHFTGHLSSLPRHAVGLASIVQNHFRVPAKIVEFVAHWLTIPERDRLQLGTDPRVGSLGMNTVLGDRVWQRQDKFQIRLGPLTLQQYEDFLPTGRLFKQLVDTVRNYLGLELMWELQPVLKKEEKPVTCLGKQGELGWTSWLETREEEEEVGDLQLQVANYV